MAALAAAGCGRPAPPLPAVETAAFQPAVRDAVESARKAAEASPDSAGAAARLGMTLHAHDQFAAAAACYRRAAALDAGRFSNHYYLGVALAADGKYAEAAGPLRKALGIDAASIPARLALADALLSDGKATEAREEYRAVIARDAAVAAAHYGLARTLDSDEAIAGFRRALHLFPRFGGAQFALAAALRKAGRAGEAAAAMAGYESNKTLAPPLNDPLMDAVAQLNVAATGLLRQAQALDREGRLAEAAELCERAAAEMPKLDQAWINLISLYGRLGEGEKLERAYRQAIAVAPNRPDAYYNYGVWCVRSERTRDAVAAFEKAVALDPLHADALNNLGSLVERSGALDRAAALFQRAIEARPGFAMAHFHLGRIYANQRKYAAAAAQFEQSLTPPSEATPAYRYALAATYARAGNRARAVEAMRQARAEAAAAGQAELEAAIGRDLARLSR